MNARKEIIYLIQVAIPFAIFGWWKHELFYAFSFLILLGIPFQTSRTLLIAGWKNLGILLGKIVSPFVLSFIYYLALTPLAFLRKVLGSDELQLNKPSKSTLKPVEKNQVAFSFEDLW